MSAMARLTVGGILCLVLVSPLFAAGGTSTVALPGHEAYVPDTWPMGAGEIVNDPSRTDGWNSWFTEWPNDVNQYAFRIESTGDVNRLIEKLAAVDAPLKRIHLCPLREPRGLGWVTGLPAGNGVPVIFSIGDQSRIDEWFAHVRKPFGVMEFLDTPVAVPPTLTLFVGNDAINLGDLEIPSELTVVAGYVPTVFLRSNTTIEKEREEESQDSDENVYLKSLENEEPDIQAAAGEILAYLKARKTEAEGNR